MKLMTACLSCLFTLQNMVIFSAEQDPSNQISELISDSTHTNNQTSAIQTLLDQNPNLHVNLLIEDLTVKFDKALCKTCCLTGFTIFCGAEAYSNYVSSILPIGLSLTGLTATLQSAAQLRHRQKLLRLLIEHENKQKME